MFERELNTLPLTVQVAYRKVASDRRSQWLGLRRLPAKGTLQRFTPRKKLNS